MNSQQYDMSEFQLFTCVMIGWSEIAIVHSYAGFPVAFSVRKASPTEIIFKC